MDAVKPIDRKDTWALPIEKVIAPAIGGIYATLPKKPTFPLSRNATALERALSVGDITLEGDLFRGVRGAAVSRELEAMGGKYLAVGVWQVPLDRIPYALRAAANKAREEKGAWLARLSTAAKLAAPLAIDPAMLIDAYRQLESKIMVEFKKTVGVEPFPMKMETRAKEFQFRVEDAVRGFSEQETKRISALIQKAAEDKWSVAKLESALAGRENVGREKARWMARQGMAVATTDIKADYYISAGLPRYRWQTKGDDRVRSDHAILDGEIFEWANPPVVNQSTGMRAHPSQDYNCRCVSVPLRE